MGEERRPPRGHQHVAGPPPVRVLREGERDAPHVLANVMPTKFVCAGDPCLGLRGFHEKSNIEHDFEEKPGMGVAFATAYILDHYDPVHPPQPAWPFGVTLAGV